MIDYIDDFVVANTGTIRLPLVQTFAVVKSVLLTVQTDGNGGVFGIVNDKSATLGPDIEVRNISDARVTGLIDAVVVGY